MARNLKHLSHENASVFRVPISSILEVYIGISPCSGNHHIILQLGRHFERMGPPSWQQ